MQQGQKRTLERDAYSETSSPKRAMSEDPAFASDGASSSASRSPPPRVAVDQALALEPEPGGAAGSPLQRQNQQQVAEGQMEDLHLSSDAAEADDAELGVPSVDEHASSLDADEAASSATVVGPTPSASGSLPRQPSTMSAELEVELAAEQQAEHDRSLSNAEKLAMVTSQWFFPRSHIPPRTQRPPFVAGKKLTGLLLEPADLKKQPLTVKDSWYLVDRKVGSREGNCARGREARPTRR